MAQEASKEPTMEEILASIRKIISEDDAPQPAKAQNAPVRLDPNEIAVTDDIFAAEESELAENADDNSGEGSGGLSFEELVADVSAQASEAVVDDAVETAMAEAALEEEAVFEAEPFDNAPFEEAVMAEDDGIAQEEEFLPPPPLTEAVSQAQLDAATASQPAPDPNLAADVPDAPLNDPLPPTDETEVNPMAQSIQSISLTEEKTADAAAGALARLVAKMDMGSENTLEGIVRELLKPMLKEWLDQNLPQIVEEKVEAEVQRIARLAR
ncbi:MAG: DUF2497 domain-containing protein [Pseudomonadota bacterium]